MRMGEGAVRDEQIRALYRQGPPLLIANVTNAMLVAVVLWSPARGLALSAWIAATAAVTALRLAMRRSFLRQSAGLAAESMTAWGRRFVAGAGAAGLLWGTGAVAFFDPRSAVSQALITFVIAGNTAGAAGTQSCYMPSFLAYFLAALVPFTARLAAVGDALHLGMAVLVATYGTVLMMVARGTHAAIRETFRLRFENDALVADLSRATIDLARSNTELEERVKERTSELERQSEALRAARQLESVGRLAAGVAHDFNNLLTVVMANATEMVERPPARREEARALLGDIVAAGERGTDLVKQLLAFGRRQKLQPRTFDLNDLIDQEARLLGRLIGADVALELALAPEALPVQADPTQVHQVLVNLVTNA